MNQLDPRQDTANYQNSEARQTAEAPSLS